LPRDAHAARGQRHQALAAQGKLVETLVKEPLQGFNTIRSLLLSLLALLVQKYNY